MILESPTALPENRSDTLALAESLFNVSCFCSIGTPIEIPIRTFDDGSLTFSMECGEGLYQLSVVADGSAFDWESLYLDLHRFGNKGERTGPWDFDLLNDNAPLVPSYWVWINGRKVGLWNFQRISLDDLSHRRFRGRFSFWRQEAGPLTIRFIPFKETAIRWVSARLEVDPEDSLDPSWMESSQVASQTPWLPSPDLLDPADTLATTRLDEAFRWAASMPLEDPHALSLHVLNWCLSDKTTKPSAAINSIERMIVLPCWGNPREHGYGHNGDILAALNLRVLTLCYVALPLDATLKKELLAKVALQGNLFIEQMLLNRDYWGGSLLQDHGWRSSFSFATAALTIAQHLPDAKRWLSYIIPRVDRALAAMPRDGVIPQSSYGDLHLYVDELAYFRDAMLSFVGRDIYDEIPVHEVIDYLESAVCRPENLIVSSGAQSRRLLGGNLFLRQIADKFGDPRAAACELSTIAHQPSSFQLRSEEKAYHVGAAWRVLYSRRAPSGSSTIRAKRDLHVFADSGLVNYHDDISKTGFSIRCGPWAGHHAYRRALGPCDRISSVPGSGHFVVSLDGDLLLTTPDFGYRMRSFQRSCMLIEDQGQIGDIGYPMSIPSATYHGEDYELVNWDMQRETGRVVLNLTPCYPAEHGLTSYRREFILEANKLICRDQVHLDKPKQLSWLFHTTSDFQITQVGTLATEICGKSPLRLEARPLGCALSSRICKTEVVWSYASASGRAPFCHVRYDTTTPVAAVSIDFVMDMKDVR